MTIGDLPEPITEEQDGVGIRDAFTRLYTPHRMAYIKGEGKPAGDASCPFCTIPGLEDAEGLVVARGELCFAVLNLYPYNSGHLMVVPYRHVSGYEELTREEATELAAMTQHAVRALKHASGAQGFNVGMNLGSIAGAGIAAHLHQHVVPTCTSTSSRAGAATPTSCLWSGRPGCSRSCCPTPASCWPGAGPRSDQAGLSGARGGAPAGGGVSGRSRARRPAAQRRR